jgi:6-phosphogluconolactonase
MKRVFAEMNELVEAAADYVVDVAEAAVARNGRCLLALSGGSTPQALFRRLSRPDYAGRSFWADCNVLWGDERLVPPDDPESSYKMAHDLLLRHVPIPAGQIYRARGEWAAADAAAHYEQQLRQLAPAGRDWPRFDLVLLGLGGDGHIASLFPGPIPPEESSRPVITVTADYEGRPANRLSLTPLVFNDAHHLLFLVTGASKAEAVRAIDQAPYDPETWPAQRIRPHDGQVAWFLDEAAAGAVNREP